jgi:hypothetical protein
MTGEDVLLVERASAMSMDSSNESPRAPPHNKPYPAKKVAIEESRNTRKRW